jgi:preprotein translocase subunit SecG
MGGQSAFGTKAGDLFTRITIGVAAAWIVLCIVSIKVLTYSGDLMNLPSGASGEQQSQTTQGPGQGTPPAESDAGGGGTPAVPGGPEGASKN